MWCLDFVYGDCIDDIYVEYCVIFDVIVCSDVVLVGELIVCYIEDSYIVVECFIIVCFE